MNTTRRYFLLVLGLIGLSGAYSAYWHIAASRIEQAFEAWTIARTAEGYAVDFNNYAVTGFPGRLQLAIDQLKIANPEHRLTWSWHSDQVNVHIQPWNLSHAIVDFGNEQDVAWTTSEIPQQMHLNATSAKASFRFSDNRISRMDWDILRPSASGTNFPGQVSAARLQIHLRAADTDTDKKQSAQDGHDLHVMIEDILLPDDAGSFLGTKLPLLRAEILLPKPEPTDIDQLAAWRDAGGIVEFTHLDMKWGTLDLRSSGTLTLDKEMRPLAALSADIRGYTDVIDGLARSGKMHKSIARNLRLGMQLLAKPGTDGQPVLSVPITAQDGMLFVGPLRIMMLDPLPVAGAQNLEPESPAPRQ